MLSRTQAIVKKGQQQDHEEESNYVKMYTHQLQLYWRA